MLFGGACAYGAWRFVHRETGEVRPFDCGAWVCPVHGGRRVARLKAAIIREARVVLSHNGRQPVRMLTLTLDPKRVHSASERIRHRHLKTVWRRLRERIRKRIGRAMEFIAVVEAHKSGMPHLHALTDAWLDKEWVNEVSAKVGGGMTRVEAVKSLERVDRYLSKYLGKEMLAGKMPRRMRRVSSSRGIKLALRPKGSGKWVLDRGRAAEASRTDGRQGRGRSHP